jgi:hypothetical protein
MRTKSQYLCILILILLVLFSCTKKSVLSPTSSPVLILTAIPTATAVSAAGSDAYENDDTFLNAKTITVNAPAQHHNFYDSCDNDYIKFFAVSGTYYTIQTMNLGGTTDTKITLYSTDGTTVISSNDDYSGGVASRITWTAAASGTYYVKIVEYYCHYGANFTYDIMVTAP